MPPRGEPGQEQGQPWPASPPAPHTVAMAGPPRETWDRTLSGAAAVSVTGLATGSLVGWASLPEGQQRLGWLEVTLLVAALVVVGLSWTVAASAQPDPLTASGVLLLTIGALVPTWAAWQVGQRAQVAALAVWPLVLFGVVFTGWRRGQRLLDRAVLLLVLGLGMAAVLLLSGGYNPFTDPACRSTCAATDPLFEPMLSTGQAVRLSSLLVGLAALTALICGTRRAGRAWWAFTQGVALAAVAVSAVLRVIGYGRPAPGWGRWPDALLASAVVVVGLGALEEIRRTRSVRRQVARFADELSTLPGQRDADNRPAVHEVQFADFDGEWVTADGAAAALDADLPQLELIDRHGRPTVRLVPRAGTPAYRLGRSVTPAARLALENARLAALARRRMTEVEESRHRLVTASAVELRRIGRDLHDGAQQRLVGVLFHLRATSTAGNDRLVRDELDAAEEAVTRALSTLREIAHRHAGSTTTAGLIPSIRESLWRAGVPATVRGSLTREPPAAVGQVLHGAVRSLLEDVATRTGATRVEVEVNEIESQLEVTVRDDGSDNNPAPSSRRLDAAVAVASAGGTLIARVGEPPSAGVEVTLRCAW